MTRQCLGKTRRGKQCKNITGDDYCHCHKHQSNKNNINQQIKNNKIELEECPICFEERKDEDKIIFSCKHYVCKQCIHQLNKCPFCRKDISNEKPTKLDNPIIENTLSFSELVTIFGQGEATLLVNSIYQDL